MANSDKWKPGWKVTAQAEGVGGVRFPSVVVGYWHNTPRAEKHARRLYEVGEETTPRLGCGPLCVFATYEAAREYSHLLGDFVIHPCAYVHSRELTAWHTGNDIRLYQMPEGTRLADRVYLLPS